MLMQSQLFVYVGVGFDNTFLSVFWLGVSHFVQFLSFSSVNFSI